MWRQTSRLIARALHRASRRPPRRVLGTSRGGGSSQGHSSVEHREAVLEKLCAIDKEMKCDNLVLHLGKNLEIAVLNLEPLIDESKPSGKS